MEETNQSQPNQEFTNPTNGNINSQIPLTNSTAVLVLGILSIVSCFCYGVPGLIMGIIALVLASKANRQYQENPNRYFLSSYNNMKAGKVCAIIGTILSGLMFLYMIVVLAVLGAAFTAMPWESMMNQ
jgi:hypothetical protein